MILKWTPSSGVRSPTPPFGNCSHIIPCFPLRAFLIIINVLWILAQCTWLSNKSNFQCAYERVNWGFSRAKCSRSADWLFASCNQEKWLNISRVWHLTIFIQRHSLSLWFSTFEPDPLTTGSSYQVYTWPYQTSNLTLLSKCIWLPHNWFHLSSVHMWPYQTSNLTLLSKCICWENTFHFHKHI